MSPAKQAPVDVSQEELLNHSHLETLRSVGIIDKVVPQALQVTRSLLENLEDPVARRESAAARELLHNLIGLCGNMGSHTLHQKVRSMYAQLVDHQQWPAPGWHEELLQLHTRTGQALRERYLPQA
ncbi:MAG TPA: hypothetical protein VLJ86_17085 [Ramlibacter sp.]|nr:hypothetical protein [Ramlibacter sp.]